MVSHRALANVLLAFQEVPGFSSRDVMLAVTTITFDIATLEVFLPLITGGTVALAAQALAADPRRLLEFAARAGATVLHGTQGFGAHSTIHKDTILRLSSDLPVVIEVVDNEEKIREILPALDPMLNGGLVTLEKVQVIHYGPGKNAGT